MRLKKVKNAMIIIENSPYFIKNPVSYKGNFKSLFKNTNEIHLEIGVGKGDFIINSALENPNINYIGIEKYDSVLIRAIEKLESYKMNNIYLINEDAFSIEEIFYDEITTLYLNFSDPWPKKRHSDRRLTSELFLKKYENIFTKDCHIIQKTDNRNLFESSLINFVNSGYKLIDLSLDLHNSNPISNILTEYEKKFSEMGFPIYKVEVKKVKGALY